MRCEKEKKTNSRFQEEVVSARRRGEKEGEGEAEIEIGRKGQEEGGTRREIGETVGSGEVGEDYVA